MVDMENKENEVEQLFADLKAKEQSMDHQGLNEIHDNAMILASKYMKTKQVRALNKLIFVIEAIDREHKILDAGITNYIYRDDIEFYIDTHRQDTSHPVKVIELERYERDIPDEIAEKLSTVSSIFDQCYVIFTDYTSSEEKKIEATSRVKDPILVGTFQDTDRNVCVDRFYVIGDWVDEYCDLTLDKLLKENLKNNKDSMHEIIEPGTIEELKEFVQLHKEDTNSSFVAYSSPTAKEYHTRKKSFFDKIRSFFR